MVHTRLVKVVHSIYLLSIRRAFITHLLQAFSPYRILQLILIH